MLMVDPLLEADIYEEEMKLDDICVGCGGLAIVYYESKYNGFRAKCDTCGINWAVS